MILLLSTAFALTCEEVANMERAGVPDATIISELNRAGTPIDAAFLGCLIAQEADDGLLKASARLHETHPPLARPLERTQSASALRRVQLELECGSAEIRASRDGAYHLRGHTQMDGQLRWTPQGDRLDIAIVDGNEVPGGSADASLPQFFAPTTVQKPTKRRRVPCADLVLEVPASHALTLKTTRADVRMVGLAGDLDLTNHFGVTEVVGASSTIRARTTDGDLVLDTGATLVEVDTVSGTIAVGAGPDAQLTLKSISGDLWVWGGPVRHLSASAVSGDLHLFGTFAPGGRGRLVTHGGSIEARVPPGRVQVASHEGTALGLERKNRTRNDAFADASMLGPAYMGVWKSTPQRWWFASGAVLSTVQKDPSIDFDLSAQAFSGTVDVTTRETFPTATGPLLATLERVRGRLDSCAADQFARSGGKGHAIATLVVEATGELGEVSAPATGTPSQSLATGELSACVTNALQNLTFPAAGVARVRWPVRYGPPLDLPTPEDRAQVLRTLDGR